VNEQTFFADFLLLRQNGLISVALYVMFTLPLSLSLATKHITDFFPSSSRIVRLYLNGLIDVLAGFPGCMSQSDVDFEV